MQLIELYKKKFEKTNPARIKFEKILRKIIHFMSKSKIFYKICVVLSKMFGFFMPFSNVNEPVSIKHHKPGLVGYQIAFNNINCEISDMKYRSEK